MKKVTLILGMIVLSITMLSCGNNTDKKSSTENKTNTQSINMRNLVGEWECVDIANGVTHMKSIAKMQPHIVFNDKYEIFFKIKLPDGSFTSQKIGLFNIEKGKVISKAFDKNLYMENNNLIKENPSEGNKQIYKKIIN